MPFFRRCNKPALDTGSKLHVWLLVGSAKYLGNKYAPTYTDCDMLLAEEDATTDIPGGPSSDGVETQEHTAATHQKGKGSGRWFPSTFA